MPTKHSMAAAAAAVLLALSASSATAHNGAHANNNNNGGGGVSDPVRFFAGMPWFGGAAGGGQPGPGGARPGGGFFGAWGEGGLGYKRGAVVPPSTVCPDDGPCRGKRLTCPPRCFRTFSYGGKNGGGGGGGGGCSFDCTTRCAATC